jgi:hypothetical protein
LSPSSFWAVLWYFANYPWNISIPFFKRRAAVNGVTYVGAIITLFFIIFVLLGASKQVKFDRRNDGLATSIAFIADIDADRSDLCFCRRALVVISRHHA